MKVSIIIEKDADGYYAFCPDLSGCQTQGAMFEEADANIREELQSIGSTVVYSTTVDVAAYA